MAKQKSAPKCEACSTRNAHHSDAVKDDIRTRLNRIEGQIRGIKRMIDEDQYCDGVLNQITSVQSALHGVSMILLEHHIKSCVVEQVTEGKPEVVDELLKTIRRMGI